MRYRYGVGPICSISILQMKMNGIFSEWEEIFDRPLLGNQRLDEFSETTILINVLRILALFDI
jgi:hypothetical protein